VPNQKHNTYLKPEKYVALALAKLEFESVLPNVVTRYNGDIHKGARNDTVIIWKTDGITKARDYEWRTRNMPIVMDEIYRTSAAIQLGTHTYNGIPLTDEELTMDLSSFATEILDPQMNAVRDRLESKVVTALNNSNFKVTNLDAAESDDPYRFSLQARAVLNAQGTPARGRYLLVGSNVEPWLLDSDKLEKRDLPASASAFREASLYRMGGFDILSSMLIDPNAIFALHQSWAVLGNLAPEIPQGVTYGARQAFQGYSLRVIRDYDANYLQDRSVVSTYSGISEIKDEFLRYTAADETGNTAAWAARPDGYGVGDIVILDGQPQYTGMNVRGARGTFTPATP
jgi:hypothetical protein